MAEEQKNRLQHLKDIAGRALSQDEVAKEPLTPEQEKSQRNREYAVMAGELAVEMAYPPAGIAIGAKDLYKGIKEESPLLMGVGALGLIPVAGPLVRKAFKAAKMSGAVGETVAKNTLKDLGKTTQVADPKLAKELDVQDAPMSASPRDRSPNLPLAHRNFQKTTLKNTTEARWEKYIDDNNAQKVAEYVGKHAEDPKLRAVAKQIAPYLERTQIHLVKEDTPMIGALASDIKNRAPFHGRHNTPVAAQRKLYEERNYIFKNDLHGPKSPVKKQALNVLKNMSKIDADKAQVFVRPRKSYDGEYAMGQGAIGTSVEVVMHELTHAVTVDRMRLAGRLIERGESNELTKAYKNLQEVARQINESFADDVAKGVRGADPVYTTKPGGFNAEEMIAYSFTDPAVQAYLKTKKIKMPGGTIVGLWDVFLKAVGKLLGIGPKDDNALRYTVEFTNDLLQAKAPDLGPSTAVGRSIVAPRVLVKDFTSEVPARTVPAAAKYAGLVPATKVTKIISGGQHGADASGVIIGRELGLETGGAIPAGRKTELGPLPDNVVETYGFKELKGANYAKRTQYNVENSDATVIFGNVKSPGSRQTLQMAKAAGKPVFLVSKRSAQLSDDLRAFLVENDVSVLNVAGNRKSKNPGVEELTKSTLVEALMRPAKGTKVVKPVEDYMKLGAYEPNPPAVSRQSQLPKRLNDLISKNKGVNVMRGSKYGNPFVLAKVFMRNPAYYKKQGYLSVPDKIDAVEAYTGWIKGESFLGFRPAQRAAIIHGIESGELQGQTLKYFMPDAPLSHVTELLRMVYPAYRKKKINFRNFKFPEITIGRPRNQDYLGAFMTEGAIGNPWSAYPGKGVFDAKNTEDAVKQFSAWLHGTDHKDKMVRYRRLILEQLPNLVDKKLVKSGNTEATAHLSVLKDYLTLQKKLKPEELKAYKRPGRASEAQIATTSRTVDDAFQRAKVTNRRRMAKRKKPKEES